jgi:hypothetical protein
MRLPETQHQWPTSTISACGLRSGGLGAGKALLNAARTASHELGITRLGLNVSTFKKVTRSVLRHQGSVAVRGVLYQR